MTEFFNIKNSKNNLYNLIIFPHAGGNPFQFYSLGKNLPSKYNIWCYQLPGHGTRFNEALCCDVDLILEDCYKATLPLLNQNTIFLGHSLGAQLCFLIASRLEQNNQPINLIILSSRNPDEGINPEDKINRIDLESEKEIVKLLREYGQTPDEILGNQQMREMIVNSFRNDIKLLRGLAKQKLAKSNIKAYIIGGESDSSLSIEKLKNWQEYFKNRSCIRMFKGNHFYLFQQESGFERWLTTLLKEHN